VTEITPITEAEIAHARQLLEDYPEAQLGLDVLARYQGDPKTSIEALITTTPTQAARFVAGRPPRPIWEILLEQIYLELCGEEEDSLREMVKQAKRNPDSSPLLSGLIVYLVDLVDISINPAIATVLVLYILKIGISTFCEYTAQYRRPSSAVTENPI
jgi:hypothetical protein